MQNYPYVLYQIAHGTTNTHRYNNTPKTPQTTASIPCTTQARGRNGYVRNDACKSRDGSNGQEKPAAQRRLGPTRSPHGNALNHSALHGRANLTCLARQAFLARSGQPCSARRPTKPMRLCPLGGQTRKTLHPIRRAGGPVIPVGLSDLTIGSARPNVKINLSLFLFFLLPPPLTRSRVLRYHSPPDPHAYGQGP